MPQWLPQALLGLLLGLVIAGINHFLVVQVLRQADTLPAEKAKNKIMIRYGVRYLLNLAALFAVHKNAPMLIGTALGLTANKNMLFFKYLRNPGKKGVS